VSTVNQTGLVHSICGHMHIFQAFTHFLSLVHTHTCIHPNPIRDIIAQCNIPTTLYSLVCSDMIPLHRRNRKPWQERFHKAVLWLSLQTCNSYPCHTQKHTKHQSLVITSMFKSHKDERHSNNQAFHHCLFLISSFLIVFRVW